MGHNLPVKKSDTIVDKFKNWWKNLFSKKESNNTPEPLDSNIAEEKDALVSFVDSMKEEFEKSASSNSLNRSSLVGKMSEKEIDKILENPEILYDMSMEQLAQIETSMDQQIAKYEVKLSKLKKQNG